jgi:aryl-alcohol dehydrogenase-like predicted oxidoreductase
MKNSATQIERLILGSVQLGLPYGVANKTGQPDQKNATKIIESAWAAGVKEFDTAQGYGDAEAVLGKAFRELGISNDVSVINKFAHQIDHLNENLMLKELEKSLNKLGVSHFSSMMLHSESLLSKWNEGLGDIFQRFVQSQKIGSVGISIYSPENALKALEQEGIAFIQIPGNVIDRRFERLGVFDFANAREKKVYIRSVFLQGLLLMTPKEIPVKMQYAAPTVEKFVLLSRKLGLTREEIALGFIKDGYPECQILLGVDSVTHLRKNLAAWVRDNPDDLVSNIRTVFNDVPENITNWNFWPK